MTEIEMSFEDLYNYLDWLNESSLPGTKGYEAQSESEEEMEEKGVRYVRTPEGAERYGQPIGTPIVTDSAGNPLSHAVEAASGAAQRRRMGPRGGSRSSAPDAASGPIQWEERFGDRSWTKYGRYSVDVEPDGKRWKWTISINGRTDTGAPFRDDLEFGTAPDRDTARAKAERAVKKRDREYQHRPKREHSALWEDYVGIYGYDYWLDGRDVSDQDLEDFEEKRWDLVEEHMKRRGIHYRIGGAYNRMGGDVDVQALEATMAILETHESWFPGFIDFFDTIVADDMKLSPHGGNVLAYNGVQPNYWSDAEAKSMIGINSVLFSAGRDFEELEKSPRFNMSFDNKNNWFSTDIDSVDKKVGDEFELWQNRFNMVMVHELGHTMANVGFGRIGDDKEARDEFHDGLWTLMYNWGFLKDEDIDENTFRMEIFHNQSHAGGGKYAPMREFHRAVIGEVLSLYGSTSIHEMCAEAWAEYLMDPNPRQFSVELSELLTDVMQGYLERKNGVVQ